MKNLVLLACLLLPACAGYSITRDGKGDGYDVFTPAPYLLAKPLVGKDGAPSTVDYEIVWLPDYSRRYRVDTWNFLATGHFKFTIADGWKLVSIDSESDNTALVQKLLDVVQGSLKPGTIALAAGGPQLFKIVFDEAGLPKGLYQLPAVGAPN